MVTVCVEYSDFLAQTLPINMQQVDRLVVVTSPFDKQTVNLCNKFGVDCVQTTAMYDEGDKFNKGRAINLGLGHCRGKDWFLHLDADIVLPHGFRNMIHRARIEEKKLYGSDRMNVYGYDTWMKNKDKLVPHYSNRYFVEPAKSFPLGARIIHYEHGYTPIGYFQLWHSSLHKRYPINQGTAEHTDVLFAAQWSRHDRVLLPEVFVYHLESVKGPAPIGANWGGRTTPFFGPALQTPAQPPYGK